MKYVVLTARHHDGFCLFDDGADPFTSVNTAARRDFVAEYVKAVRKVGLRVGLYWVEKGIAPKSVVATGRAFPGRSRPLCPYPQHAHYKGQGNTEDANNFECR
jgi:hypothetical protein